MIDLWILSIDSENVNIKIQYAANNPGVIWNYFTSLFILLVSFCKVFYVYKLLQLNV